MITGNGNFKTEIHTVAAPIKCLVPNGAADRNETNAALQAYVELIFIILN